MNTRKRLRIFFRNNDIFYFAIWKDSIIFAFVKSGLQISPLQSIKQIMTDKISHEGIIDAITPESVMVRICQTSACAHCKAASYCNASESKVKMVCVSRKSAAGLRLQVGDEVRVSASGSTASKALLLSFGLPFLVLVATLTAVLYLTSNEVWSALAALGSLIPYYIVIYLMRHSIGRRIAFGIDKVNNMEAS